MQFLILKQPLDNLWPVKTAADFYSIILRHTKSRSKKKIHRLAFPTYRNTLWDTIGKMARIRCHYLDCACIDGGFCSAASVEIDPNGGCLTHAPTSVMTDEDAWVNDEIEEWDEIDTDDDDDDEDVWSYEDENPRSSSS